MLLLSEFSGYNEWGKEAKRWTRTLYIRTTILVVDCFLSLILEKVMSLTDKEAIGHLKRKLKLKIDENQGAVGRGVSYEPIDYE